MNPKVKESLDRIRREAIAKVQASRRTFVPLTPEIDDLQQRYNELEKQHQALRAKQKPAPNLTVPERLAAEITGEVADVVRTTLSDFNGEIARRAATFNMPELNGNFYIYPEGCRFTFFPPNSDMGVVVVEQPPQFRTINVGGINYHLPFPYVVFVVILHKTANRYVFHRLLVGFISTALRSLSDQLHAPELGNFTSQHVVCMGGFTAFSDSYCEVVDQTISEFWQSQFISHQPYFTCKNKIIDNYSKWAKLDLLKILQAQFQRGDILEVLTRLPIKNPPEIRTVIQEIISTSYQKVFEKFDLERVTDLIQIAAEDILESQNNNLQSEIR